MTRCFHSNHALIGKRLKNLDKRLPENITMVSFVLFFLLFLLCLFVGAFEIALLSSPIQTASPLPKLTAAAGEGGDSRQWERSRKLLPFCLEQLRRVEAPLLIRTSKAFRIVAMMCSLGWVSAALGPA